MWPVRLVEGDVVLRPLARRDATEWARLRAANAAWLAPWEATAPAPALSRPPTFSEYVRDLNRQARAGGALPFAITWRGAIVGQLTVSGIVRGSLCSASVGYWVGQDVAGRGLTPLAVAMASDYCWGVLGLHRIEINIRPENAASLRVVSKLGFRDEGLRVRFLHIHGEWADHRTFALTAEEVPGGLLPRARALPSRL